MGRPVAVVYLGAYRTKAADQLCFTGRHTATQMLTLRVGYI